ncbi:MAG: hypothetical protein MK135_03740 [Polyangiaceae bacterium]|nr:hypothetical protein [Polyangiaceae bacterium]
MKEIVITIGLGQLGRLFSEAFLLSGCVVLPVRRQDSIADAAHAARALQPSNANRPPIWLVAVGEDDLQDVLKELPPEASGRVLLIQNELRPEQWSDLQLNPTLAIIWFEKKGKKAPHIVLPSVISGPLAPIVHNALKTLDLDARELPEHDEAKLIHELILKNLYILCLNFAGLAGAKTAASLLDAQQGTLKKIFDEVLHLEKAAFARTHPTTPIQPNLLWTDLQKALQADPDHGCAGRSAPRRLERTLDLARALHLQIPQLNLLQQSHLNQ